MSSFLYFAYGSNLLTQRMHINCPSAQRKCIAELKKFKLVFCDYAKSWKGAVATIVECETDSVWGVLWEISKQHEEKLNRQERRYQPITVKVKSSECIEIECKTYKMLSSMEANSLPSSVYKNVIVNGAIENQLPSSYIKRLEQIADNGYNGPVDIPVSGIASRE